MRRARAFIASNAGILVRTRVLAATASPREGGAHPRENVGAVASVTRVLPDFFGQLAEQRLERPVEHLVQPRETAVGLELPRRRATPCPRPSRASPAWRSGRATSICGSVNLWALRNPRDRAVHALRVRHSGDPSASCRMYPTMVAATSSFFWSRHAGLHRLSRRSPAGRGRA